MGWRKKIEWRHQSAGFFSKSSSPKLAIPATQKQESMANLSRAVISSIDQAINNFVT